MGMPIVRATGPVARLRIGAGPQGDKGDKGDRGDQGLQGAPGGSDAAQAGWINDTASATRAALNAAFARKMGWAVVTDPQYAGGASTTGGDGTAAIDAARASNNVLFFPPGSYAYNGDGLNADVDGRGITILGSGRLDTVITLGAGKSLIVKPTGGPWQMHVEGIKVSGGYGAIRLASTAITVQGSLVVQDCVFEGYTGAAISSLAADQPYWKIRNNIFRAANGDSTVGVALHGDNAGSVIEGNQFLLNGVHLKLGGTCGAGARVRDNDFIRFAGYNTAPRVDIWLAVPSGSGVPVGAGLMVTQNKFGPENVDGRDYRILVAPEDTANTDQATRRPLLSATTSRALSSVSIADNIVGGSDNNAPVFLTINGQVRDSTIDGLILSGSTGPNVVRYLNSPGDADTETTNVLSHLRGDYLVYGDWSFFTPISHPGLWIVDDPSYRVADPTAAQSHVASPDAAATYAALALSPTWNKINASSSFTAGQADVTGGVDAVTFEQAASSDNFYCAIPNASLVPGRPVWIEFDGTLAGTAPQSGLVVKMVNNGAIKWQRALKLPVSGWHRYTLRYVPKQGTGVNQMVVSTTSGRGSFKLGRVRVYTATQPVSVDGWFADRVQAPGGVSTKQKAGTPTDADFRVVKDGLLAVDSSGSRLWARVNGVWKSVPLT